MGSLHPAAATLNMPPDLFSLGVRRRIAEEAARGDFDAVVETLTATTGASVGKRQAQELAAKAAADFDDFYAQKAETVGVRGRESFLVITADGKGIVMRQEDCAGPPRPRPAGRVSTSRTKCSACTSPIWWQSPRAIVSDGLQPLQRL